MKTCPFCAETIQDGAVKCRYCGSVLVAEAAERAAASLPRRAGPQEGGGVPWGTLALAVGAVALIVALGVGAGLLSRWRRGAAVDQGARPAAAVASTPYSFGVAWGAPPSTVSMQLMGRGLSFSEHDEDGDQVYSGTVDGNQAIVIAMFARGGLAKVIVAYQMPADPKAAYEATVARLTARYGPAGAPSTTTDGRPVTSWPPRRDETGDTRVWTTITDTKDVVIHYESGGWKAEAERRKE